MSVLSLLRSSHLLWVAPVLVSACGGGGASAGSNGDGGQSGSTGSSTGSSGSLAVGGKSGSGGASSAGSTGSGGALAAGGKTGGGGVTSAGGSAVTGGGGTVPGAGAAGRSSADAAASSGGTDSGGASAGRDGGGADGPGQAASKADGGTEAGSAGGCSRDLLKSTIDAYFKALASHSAATLPLAADVKFTENGKVLKVGEDGLWKTAGTLKHAHSALDTDGCNTASEAVVPDGSTDIPFALRLKLQGGSITEIETIAVRAGDYSVSSNTNAIIQTETTVKWEDPVPADDRNTREELMAWMDKYFRIFPRGVCNTTSSCKRLENGGGSFSCSSGASCDSGQPSTSTKPAVVSHIIFADEETGVGAGFDLFQNNADMHIFKMYGGQVYAVDAILGKATSTGWD